MRLRLADNPELAELPWEFLYDPRRDRFLAQSRRVGHRAADELSEIMRHYL
jgi:hypothetical protein